MSKKLDIPAFARITAAEAVPELFNFTVEGRDCFVKVRRLDFAGKQQYATTGVTFDEAGKVKEIDAERRARFLLGKCVVDWLWYQRPELADGSGLGELTEARAPENKKERQLFWDSFPLDDEFGGWLHGRCQEVCGLTPEAEGNSAPASTN